MQRQSMIPWMRKICWPSSVERLFVSIVAILSSVLNLLSPDCVFQEIWVIPGLEKSQIPVCLWSTLAQLNRVYIVRDFPYNEISHLSKVWEFGQCCMFFTNVISKYRYIEPKQADEEHTKELAAFCSSNDIQFIYSPLDVNAVSSFAWDELVVSCQTRGGV